MSTFVTALEAALRRGTPRRRPNATWARLAETAPPDARRLLVALARHAAPRIDLGFRECCGDGDVETFEHLFATCGVGDSLANYFDPAASVTLGRTTGDEVAWGFHWAKRRLVFVEVELDFAYRAIRAFDTPDAYFSYLRAAELAWAADNDLDGPTRDLIALAVAAGKPA